MTSLQLEAEGHPGQTFSPGQFAWIRLTDLQSSLAEHPFSYASSARRPKQPVFAIRAKQGFTAQVPSFARSGRASSLTDHTARSSSTSAPRDCSSSQAGSASRPR